MMTRLHMLTARLTLLLMLATLFSPGLGWQMVVVHEHGGHHHLAHTGHADASDGSAHHMHDVSAPDAQPADDLASVMQNEHDDAHTMMGHLLGHMPLTLTQETRVDASVAGMVMSPQPSDGIPGSLPSALFRPPQALVA